MANAVEAEGGFSDVASLDCSGVAEIDGELGGVGTSLDWPAVESAGLTVSGLVLRALSQEGLFAAMRRQLDWVVQLVVRFPARAEFGPVVVGLRRNCVQESASVRE